ncbi:MAG: type II toxin-antitoxin system RelE/ParE family toxin [Desulfamplus sp.]|nr:type II toxin-antitoxin system RelE/ParE family toxin [Desulfamplus sp.]
MPQYQKDYTDDFKKDVKEIKSDFELQKRLTKKIDEIAENPHHYKPLRNILKNKRRVHIGSFVLIFEILEEEKIVVFHTFKHHDEAY